MCDRHRFQQRSGANTCDPVARARPLTAGAPLALDEESFAAELAAIRRPVVVELWAAWCGPCRVLAPTFASAAALHPDRLFANVDTEANLQLSAQPGIRSIPTLMEFRDGRPVERISDALPSAQFEQWPGAAARSAVAQA